jgi:hypothetical protein
VQATAGTSPSPNWAGRQPVRDRRLVIVNAIVARLAARGPARPVWRVAGGQDGCWRLDRLPAAQ